jgi:PadR family transcriptional regulator PadR
MIENDDDVIDAEIVDDNLKGEQVSPLLDAVLAPCHHGCTCGLHQQTVYGERVAARLPAEPDQGEIQVLDITPKMAKVLKVFLEAPGQPRYGFELMKLTGMASGSMYPMLARLEEAKWLIRGKETIDPHAEGRPPRLHYTMTGAAAAAARRQLAALSDQYRPPAPALQPHRPQESTA